MTISPTRRQRAHVEKLGDRERLDGESDAVFAAAADAMLVYDSDGTIARANQAANAIFGFDPVGLDRRALIHKVFMRRPDGQPFSLDELPSARALLGERIVGERYLMTNAEGDEVVTLASASLLKAGEKVSGVVVTFHDITEQERLIERLAASEQAAREAMEREHVLRQKLEAQNQELGRQRQELQGANEQLESAVADRTRELVNANLALQEEIAGRQQKETELKESEARFWTVLEGAHIAMAVADLKGKLISCNPEIEQMLGYSANELRGTFASITHPDDVDLSLEPFRQLIAGEVDRYQLDNRYIRRDGEVIWGRLSASQIRDAGQKYVLATIEDVTSRKRARQALEKSEARFRAMFEGSAIGMTLGSLDGKSLMSNPALQRMLGYSAEELQRMTFSEYTHPDDLPANLEFLRRLEAGTLDHYQMDKRYIKKDGETILIRLTVSAVKGADNRPSYVVGMMEDITERKRSEAALRASEERYRSLIDLSPDVIVATDLEAKIILCNPQAATMLGHDDVRSLYGKSALEFVVPEQRQLAVEKLKQTLAQGTLRNAELDVTDIHRRIIPIELNARVITDDQARPFGFLAIMRDITERKKAEDELRQSRRNWENIFRSVGDSMMILDRDHRILEANDATLKLSGEPLESIVGKHCYEIIHRTDHPHLDCPMQRALTTGIQETNEVEVVRGGNVFLISCTPVWSETGRVEKVIHVATDITELKLAESKLQASLEKLQSTIKGTIEAMSLAVEMRDPYTAGHQRRVAILSCAIAEGMGIGEDRIRGIDVAATLHDLGKICLPGELLSKPGRLTSIEFSMVQSHCQIAQNILRQVEFPWPIAEIVGQHHERLDGSGYPQGMSDGDILLESRILAVSDTVEAMASHRPYRPALGIDKALEEVAEKSGILYDPDVVDACLKLFATGSFKWE